MHMAKVNKCQAESCSYNQNQQCHALAITIGDASNPACDTFCSLGKKGGDMATTAGIGACKVSACRFNNSLECSAEAISIGQRGGEAFCMDCQI